MMITKTVASLVVVAVVAAVTKSQDCVIGIVTRIWAGQSGI
jgi:hypothetical protein